MSINGINGEPTPNSVMPEIESIVERAFNKPLLDEDKNEASADEVQTAAAANNRLTQVIKTAEEKPAYMEVSPLELERLMGARAEAFNALAVLLAKEHPELETMTKLLLREGRVSAHLKLEVQSGMSLMNPLDSLYVAARLYDHKAAYDEGIDPVALADSNPVVCTVRHLRDTAAQKLQQSDDMRRALS